MREECDLFHDLVSSLAAAVINDFFNTLVPQLIWGNEKQIPSLDAVTVLNIRSANKIFTDPAGLLEFSRVSSCEEQGEYISLIDIP